MTPRERLPLYCPDCGYLCQWPPVVLPVSSAANERLVFRPVMHLIDFGRPLDERDLIDVCTYDWAYRRMGEMFYVDMRS